MTGAERAKMRSAVVAAYWKDIVERDGRIGLIQLSKFQSTSIPKEYVREDFRIWRAGLKNKRAVNDTSFTHGLRLAVPGLAITRLRIEKKRTRLFVFPPFGNTLNEMFADILG